MRTYAQVTNEDVETWEADLNAYVEQDDAENVLAGLRPAISDLLENMLDSFPLPVLRQLDRIDEGPWARAGAVFDARSKEAAA